MALGVLACILTPLAVLSTVMRKCYNCGSDKKVIKTADPDKTGDKTW